MNTCCGKWRSVDNPPSYSDRHRIDISIGDLAMLKGNAAQSGKTTTAPRSVPLFCSFNCRGR
ncbi:hypothetical protein KQQSB11_300126 [Klebsiella quasipneumoniae subsp. quasipneumoniae]|nr:hypothetical protein KQQSB11_300126 [Klebsiella quasipneumoniae subsp. quasipneumoniae]